MSKRIIVIDRDHLRRDEFIRALASQGWEPAVFDSGKEALKDLLFSSVHAVALDYGTSFEPDNPMPAGKNMVKEITAIDAFVPLILICDRCDLLDHETVSAVDLVLRRPIATQQALDAVKTVLGETLRERAQRKSGYIFAFR